MNLAATQYSLKDRAFDIFLAGCAAPHCPGCQNPDLWDFTVGGDLDCMALADDIKVSSVMIDRIRVMGGEPLDQHLGKLEGLLMILRHRFPEKELWLFTRYTEDETTKEMEAVLRRVDYVKHGRFIEDLPEYVCDITGIILASSNQYVRRIVSSC